MDRMIREKLYWPDGTRKKCSKAQAFENVKNMMNQLAKVILDMYNDDQNFSEVCSCSRFMSIIPAVLWWCLIDVTLADLILFLIVGSFL